MDTEELILKKTFGLLLFKGFDAVSITDIQQTTGLSRGLLYHYFKNKEELFIQVTERYFIQIFDFDIRKTKDHTVFEFADFICQRFKRIEETISDITIETFGQQDLSMLNYHFLFYQVMQKDNIFRNKYTSTIDKELIGWENSLRNSIDANYIKSNIDIVSSSKQLVTITDGIWFQSIFNSDEKTIVKKLEDSLFHYLNLLR
ncbi:MAG: TetR/AcrR family transcriptional regulator [Prevotella sp.]|jgi:hypothetical protein|nr:TetR/AcrR family transcriptional regulator [Prevotella sp.]